MLFNVLKEIERNVGKKKLAEAMEITTQDIKFNRIGFKKMTKPRDFLRILLISLDMVEEKYAG